MNATARRGARGRTGSGRRKIWMLVGLLAVGALGQACTSQEPAGPEFPAGQTGDPAFGTVNLLAEPGPGTAQFIITVFVLSGNSQAAENRRVQLHTSNGRLDRPLGQTDHDGRFQSILTCGRDGGGSVVTAFSEGATATIALCGAYGASLFRAAPVYAMLASALLIGLVLPQVVGVGVFRRRRDSTR